VGRGVSRQERLLVAEILLVHGGASPAATWSGLESLKNRWTLVTVYRGGFPPSPEPLGGHQDAPTIALGGS
jgi:hypothetical protein